MRHQMQHTTSASIYHARNTRCQYAMPVRSASSSARCQCAMPIAVRRASGRTLCQQKHAAPVRRANTPCQYTVPVPVGRASRVYFLTIIFPIYSRSCILIAQKSRSTANQNKCLSNTFELSMKFLLKRETHPPVSRSSYLYRCSSNLSFTK